MAEQARLDDLQGEGVIALADEGGGGGGELLVPAAGQQVKGGGVPGAGGRLQSTQVWLPVTGALVVEPPSRAWKNPASVSGSASPGRAPASWEK